MDNANSCSREAATEYHRLALLSRLGIREVWSVDRSRVEILRKRNGRLIGAEQSQLLISVTSSMLTRHLRSRFRLGENACIRNFIRDALHN